MLYEFGFNFHIFDLIKILIVFGGPTMIFFSNFNFESKIIRSFLILLSGAVLVFLFTVMIGFPVRTYFEIKDKINTGDMLVVEGEVSDFHTPATNNVGHDSESFSINGVSFWYNETENYGYSTFLCKGGVVTGNGQRLKITYSYDSLQSKNVICYIEALSEK